MTTTNQPKTLTKYFFDPFVIKINLSGEAWKPTPHGYALANGMVRVPHIFCGKSVIEIGAGSGIHAILALKLGARSIDITDISEDVNNVAKQNAQENNVSYRHAWVKDWMHFDPIPERYELVLCNPPFCKAGTPDRRWFITEMITQSRKFMNPGGYLIFCQSSMANFPKTEAELEEAGFIHEVVYKTRGLFRDYYFTEHGFIEESRQVPNGFEIIDDEYIETLQVYLATLKA